MKKLISILLCNFLLLHIGLSQNNFSLMFAIADTQYEQTCYAAQTSQGFYLVGHYLTYSGTEEDITDFNAAFSVFKFDKNQQLEWKQDVHPQEGVESFLQVQYNEPIKAIDGDLFMNYSYIESTPSDYFVGTGVINYADDGTLLWKQKFQDLVSSLSVQKDYSLKTIGVAYYNENPDYWPAYSITMDLDGNISDTVLIRLPLSANYERSYDYIDYAVYTEKGILFSCGFFDFSIPEIRVGKLLVALDHTGNIRWQKEYISPDGPQSFDFHKASNRIMLAKGNPSGPNDPNSLSVEVLDLDGNLVGSYYIPTQEIPISYVRRVFAGNDASFFVLGQDIANDNWLSKFNTDGTLIWKRYIKETTLPNIFLSTLDHGSIFTNGDILLSGFSADTLNSKSVVENKVNYWVVQLNANGCFNNDCNDTIKVTTTILPMVSTKAQPAPIDFQVQCFPNPATNTLNWQILNGTNDAYTYKIYDILGNIVVSSGLQYGGQGAVNLSKVASGFYIFSLFDALGQSVHSSKFQKL